MFIYKITPIAPFLDDIAKVNNMRDFILYDQDFLNLQYPYFLEEIIQK